MVHKTVQVMAKGQQTLTRNTEDQYVCPGRKTYVHYGCGETESSEATSMSGAIVELSRELELSKFSGTFEYGWQHWVPP